TANKKQIEKRVIKSTEDFIELKALGLALANAKGRNNIGISKTILDRSKVSEKPSSSVVLIDEIDKAPRDFPNDLLNETENFEFEIKELNTPPIRLENEEKQRLLIIMTSNFEKNLPEPFLRRCVYFHIDFPTETHLYNIMEKRLNINEKEIQDVKNRISDFFRIHNDPNVQKKPSTSEAIDFVRVLQSDGMLGKP